ncbi:hypothetical protein J437_LFUL015497 [Ladona fulva]|uniref:Uncharacterized protein n=1 Tax=Ladona fulva TaxID=123851 RepID=A0A8K0P703_LADFU|nr:hypothetical protein J437_LFUL015497 [Ladona fulva]
MLRLHDYFRLYPAIITKKVKARTWIETRCKERRIMDHQCRSGKGLFLIAYSCTRRKGNSSILLGQPLLYSSTSCKALAFSSVFPANSE